METIHVEARNLPRGRQRIKPVWRRPRAFPKTMASLYHRYLCITPNLCNVNRNNGKCKSKCAANAHSLNQHRGRRLQSVSTSNCWTISSLAEVRTLLHCRPSSTTSLTNLLCSQTTMMMTMLKDLATLPAFHHNGGILASLSWRDFCLLSLRVTQPAT